MQYNAFVPSSGRMRCGVVSTRFCKTLSVPLQGGGRRTGIGFLMEFMPIATLSESTSRRRLLGLVGAAGFSLLTTPLAFAASDFWNKKPFAEWSEQEIEQLKTKSPWAKKIRGEMAGGGGRAGGGGGDEAGGGGRGGGRGGNGGLAGGGIASADSNGIGGGGGGRGGRGGGGGGGGEFAAQGPEVVVRWESAGPLSDIKKEKMPKEIDGHYAISVTGLPQQMLMMAMMGGGRGRGGRGGRDGAGRDGGGREGAGREGAPPPEAPPEDPAARQKAMVARLLQSVSLSAKGHDPQAAVMVLQTADRQSLIFGFPKKDLPIEAKDKDLVFTMKLGMMTIKAKFEPKDMSYKGALSL